MTATTHRDEIYVPATTAAFIADLPVRMIHRVVDESILVDPVVHVHETRRVARLGAALASFYFESDRILLADTRRKIIEEILGRLSHRADWGHLLGLPRETTNVIDWNVSVDFCNVNLLSFIERAIARSRELEDAESLVHEDKAILGGMPVFVGTRVPIDIILASVDKGIDGERIRSSYPFVTQRHIEAARAYSASHTRMGRPRLSERYPDMKPIASGKVKRRDAR